MNKAKAAIFRELDNDKKEVNGLNDSIGSTSRKRKEKIVKTKTFNIDNLHIKTISPLTQGQRQFFSSFDYGLNIVAHGSAGTGKTYLATYLALKQLINGDAETIIFLRSSVSIRSQGHLPGSLEEKEAVYMIPFKTIVNDICECGTAWDSLIKKDKIKFITTSYIRGITLDNCVLIVDEFQNFDASEMESVLTRVGKNSRVIICGDTRQNDLNRKREISCHDWLLRIAKKMPKHFDIVKFYSSDIVRSEFCKAIIIAIEGDF